MRALGPCTEREPSRCILDIEKDGVLRYDVTIQTGDGSKDGTTSPIQFGLIGKKGRSLARVIAEYGLKSGSNKTFTIFSKHIGKITGWYASLEQKGRWKPTNISLLIALTTPTLAILIIAIISRYDNNFQQEIFLYKNSTVNPALEIINLTIQTWTCTWI